MIMNFKKLSVKGFTLIELLVVIAIIGVLSSVVLASLRNSNTKALDAKVKSQLNAMISAAQLWYDTAGNSNWTSICTTDPMDSMKKSAGAVGPAGSCQGSGQLGWRAAAPLNTQNLHTAGTSGTDYWCVDYKANTMICDTLPSGVYGGVYVCPTTSPELCK